MGVTDVLIAVLSLTVAASTFFNTRKKDTKNEGAQEASLQADLRYIKELLQDVRSEMKEITKSVDIHSEKIAKFEEQLHSAFCRIERLEKQMDGTKES
jgi:5-bromo-4-chloroindolyl phosphate hydrolysis protein